MAFLYTIIDGKKVNANAAVDFQRMNQDFHARFGYWLIISDGVRSYLEQKKLYLDYINGISGIRAANPDSDQAFHVETNPRGARAIDIRDTGPDAGVTRYGNARSAWIRDNAHRYNFDARGYREFNEPWHLEWQGVLATTDSGPAGWSGGVPVTVGVDGILGPQTIAKLQSVIGAVVDGEMGPNTITKLQERLGTKQDGELGPITISELQRRVGAVVDGDWGSGTTTALQNHLNAGGTLGGTTPSAPPVTAPGKLVVDGQLGELTIKRLQESLGVPQDGDWGPVTTSALQKAVGALVDGQLGPQTIRGLQVNVGLTGNDVDGSMGEQTVTKLQEFLNSGAPWKMVAVQPEAPVDEFLVTPRVPTLPFAMAAWNVPYGQEKRANGKLTHYIVHHETAFVSQAEYYKKRNERGNAPTWEVDGAIAIEFCHPALKPSTTGAANEYSVSSETVNIAGEPDWKVAQASLLTHAKIAAWLSQQDFISAPDGTIVDVREFVLDREHVIGHKEAGINATRCPGEYQMAHMDWIVEEAKKIAALGPVAPPVDPPIVVPPPVVTPPATLGEQIAESYRELGDLLEQLPAGV